MKGYLETTALIAQRDYDDLTGRALKLLEELDKDFSVSDVIINVRDGKLYEAVGTLQGLANASSVLSPWVGPISTVCGYLNRAIAAKDKYLGNEDKKPGNVWGEAPGGEWGKPTA
jgi:hypothetical protein